MHLPNFLECHEIFQLRGPPNTKSVAFNIRVACSASLMPQAYAPSSVTEGCGARLAEPGLLRNPAAKSETGAPRITNPPLSGRPLPETGGNLVRTGFNERLSPVVHNRTQTNLILLRPFTVTLKMVTPESVPELIRRDPHPFATPNDHRRSPSIRQKSSAGLKHNSAGGSKGV